MSEYRMTSDQAIAFGEKVATYVIKGLPKVPEGRQLDGLAVFGVIGAPCGKQFTHEMDSAKIRWAVLRWLRPEWMRR